MSKLLQLYLLAFMIPRMLTIEAQYDNQNLENGSRPDEQNTSEPLNEGIKNSTGTISRNEVTEDVEKKSGQLNERTTVTDGDQFPFMAAVVKGSSYLSAGALIDEGWVLTAADALYLMRESIKFLRVRLGSINYKKGGVSLPIKYLEIHPYFNNTKPGFDLALIMLAQPVRFTPSLRSVRLQLRPKEVTATHFMVTSWPAAVQTNKSKSMDVNHCILSVVHLHPIDHEECEEELKEVGARHDGVMCLETEWNDTCTRDVGAPIILNGMLWGVVSTWKPAGCDEETTAPVFATLVSAANTSSWIHAIIHGHKWLPKNVPNTLDI